MTDNIITWNLANWVTVVLMALVGFMLVGALVAAVKKNRGTDAQPVQQQTAQN